MKRHEFLFGFSVFSILCFCIFYFLIVGKFSSSSKSSANSKQEKVSNVCFELDYNTYMVKKGVKVYLSTQTSSSDIYYAVADISTKSNSEITEFCETAYPVDKYYGEGIEINAPTIIKTVAKKRGAKQSDFSISVFYIIN